MFAGCGPKHIGLHLVEAVDEPCHLIAEQKLGAEAPSGVEQIAYHSLSYLGGFG